jgi:hypothetical protein
MIEKVSEVLRTNRKFQSLLLELESGNQKFEPKLFENFLERHAAKTRNVKLVNVDFDDLSQLCEFLKKLENLKTLEINNSNFKFDDNEMKPQVRLESLEKLTIISHTLEIFKCFIVPRVKDLWLYCTNAQNEFTNILESIEDLQSLKVGYNGAFTAKAPQNMKLKKLSMNIREADENMIEFLRSQASSLEELKLRCSNNSERLCEAIFGPLTSLKVLSISRYILPYESFGFETTKRLKNLEKLEVFDGFKGIVSAKETLINCPNIRVFSSLIDCGDLYSRGLLEFMAINNPFVEVLNVKSIQTESEAVFERLKSFSVREVDNFEAFKKFLVLNQTIETLWIKPYTKFDVSEELNELFSSLKSLKLLKFGMEGSLFTLEDFQADFESRREQKIQQGSKTALQKLKGMVGMS